MRSRKQWSLTGLLALGVLAVGMTSTAGTAYAASRDAAAIEYDAAVLEKLRDNTLEYWEIPGLIEQYNLEYRNSLESFYAKPGGSTGLTRDQLLTMASDLRKEAAALEEDAESSKDEIGKAAYQEYRGNVRALKAFAKDLEDEAAGKSASGSAALRNLRILRNRQTKAAREKMKEYQMSADQATIAARKLELAEMKLEAAKKQKELGLCAAEAVLDAERAFNQAVAASSQADASLRKGKQELLVMLGWDYQAELEICPVPEPDPARISGYHPKADLGKALEMNYKLFDLRNQKSSSQGGVNAKARSIKTQEEEVTKNLDFLYQEVIQKQTAFQASSTAYEKAKADKAASDRKEALGMFSRQDFLEAEIAWLESEASYRAAGLSLTRAMEDYEWALEGLMDADEGSQPGRTSM